MATARDWITRAMRRSGVLAFGEDLAGEDASTALDALNDMLDLWSLEPGVILSVYSDGFNLAATVAAYSTALLALGRPVDVVSAKVTLAPQDYDVELIGSVEYDEIEVKSTPGIPECCWYNPAMPAGTFTFWPTPYSSSLVASFQCTGPIQGVLTLDTVVTTGPGYQKAIIEALACDLAPAFSRPVSPDLAQSAKEAKAWIKRSNYKPREMRTGLPNTGRYVYNINGDR